jgi:response regulator RpfG family c-di-GMP phosphodiesterase
MIANMTPTPTAEPAPNGPARPPAHPWVILLVDDELDVLNTTRDLLEQSLRDIKVITATSGRKGIEILEQERVDLVMSDFKMPGMDGIEFLVQVRRMRPALPRMMFTAFADKELAHRAVSEAVVTEFLAKNLTPGQMVGKVEALLRYIPAPPSQESQKVLEPAAVDLRR